MKKNMVMMKTGRQPLERVAVWREIADSSCSDMGSTSEVKLWTFSDTSLANFSTSDSSKTSVSMV